MSAKELMFLNCVAGEYLRVPWTARRSNQSILKEISPEYSLKGLMLKLKFQYFSHLTRLKNNKEKDAVTAETHAEKGTFNKCLLYLILAKAVEMLFQNLL